MLRIVHVVGARPNFMKIAPIMAAMREQSAQFRQTLVHTGQHYDPKMSRVFFDELELPCPDEFLNVGSGTHAEQTARAMLAFEKVLQKDRPDWVVVVGDVNSTLACALVAAKMGIPVAHVEAGLRSGDIRMPEEINRILTDRLADALFTPSADCDTNLRAEGIRSEIVYCVGNVMIDTLVRLLPRARQRSILRDEKLPAKGYLLVTLHRASNVDDPAALAEVVAALEAVAEWMPVVFPVHPRTRERMDRLGIAPMNSRVRLLEPLGYLDFVALMDASKLVLTDSGGVQEETTYLGIPCLTARPSTERPITIHSGTNRLVATDRDQVVNAVREVISSPPPAAAVPKLWDGAAARRIVQVMLHWALRAEGGARAANWGSGVEVVAKPVLDGHRAAAQSAEV